LDLLKRQQNALRADILEEQSEQMERIEQTKRKKHKQQAGQDTSLPQKRLPLLKIMTQKLLPLFKISGQ